MGGGQQQAQPPQLNVGQSLKLSEGQINQLRTYAPGVVGTLGDTSRAQTAANTLFGLGMLTDPASTLAGTVTAEANVERTRALAQLNKENDAFKKKKGNKNKNLPEYDSRLAEINARYNQSVAGTQIGDPLERLTTTFKDEFAQRDALIGQAAATLPSTAEYNRLQAALGQGVTARTTDAGALGDSLMSRAMQKMQEGRNLSPEAEREAQQSARAAMSARGLGVGNAALAAEVLNRDRYARQREAENLAFASAVQNQDLARRQTNSAVLGDTDRYNLGLLGTSSSLADADRARQLGTRQDIYNFSMSSNPRMMLAGVGSPYANMTQPAIGQLGAITGNAQPIYTGGQFSGGGGMGGALGTIGMLGGAAVGGLLAAPTGGMSIPMGMAIGGSLGGAAGTGAGLAFR